MSQNVHQPLKRLHHIVQTRQDASSVTAAKSLLEHYDRASARFWQGVGACALWAIALTLLIGMMGCAHPAPKAPVVVEIPLTPAEQDNVAVRIEVACVTGDAFIGTFNLTGAYGSGAVIENENVITANHVVRCDGTPMINVITADDRKFPATIAYQDSSRDYARIHVPGLLTTKKATFAAPHPGDEVCLVTGFPKRLRSCGTVVNVQPYSTTDNGTVDIEYTAPIVSGNSGSAMYNAHGDIIGLATNSRGILIGGLGTSVVGRVL